jgi:hypothetical protein
MSCSMTWALAFTSFNSAAALRFIGVPGFQLSLLARLFTWKNCPSHPAATNRTAGRAGGGLTLSVRPRTSPCTPTAGASAHQSGAQCGAQALAQT